MDMGRNLERDAGVLYPAVKERLGRQMPGFGEGISSIAPSQSTMFDETRHLRLQRSKDILRGASEARFKSQLTHHEDSLMDFSVASRRPQDDLRARYSTSPPHFRHSQKHL